MKDRKQNELMKVKDRKNVTMKNWSHKLKTKTQVKDSYKNEHVKKTKR